MRAAHLLATAVLLSSNGTAAQAELMIATTPGVMCKSTAALARLSMPNGASRTAANHPSPADEATARSGDCVDFSAGNVVQLQARHERTSLVRSDTLSGDGVIDTFTVANVNYGPFTPDDEFSNALRAQCPAKLEDVVLQHFPTDYFVATLPRSTQAAIEKAIDDECGGAYPCTIAQRHQEVRKRRLVPQWAAFMCRQK